MERLTKRYTYTNPPDIECVPFKYERIVYTGGNDLVKISAIDMVSKEVQKCLDKLADYEDLDERGMVIRDGDSVKCFANITFDKNDLQKMVDEKVAEIELNINAIREQTINEFIKMLNRYAFSNEYGTHIVFTPEQLDEMVAHWKAGEK